MPNLRAPLQPITTTRPRELVTIDLVEYLVSNNGNRYALVVIDYFTNYLELFTLNEGTAAAITDKLAYEYIPRLGAPEQLHSDQGKHLNAQLVINECDTLQTCKTRTTPFHPQSDGATERVIRTVNVMLSKVVSENQKDWDEKLPGVMMVYNSAVHESTGFTPYYINLDKLEAWSISSGLVFNQKKCKQQHITRKFNPVEFQNKRNDKPLEVTNHEKDVGVYVSSGLTWKKHTLEQCAKANKLLGFIRRCAMDVQSSSTRRTLYLAIVRPALGYATQVWSPQTIDLIRRIERVQRRASKFILDLPFLCEESYRDRLLSIDILPICYCMSFWTWSFSLRPPMVLFVYHMACSLYALFPQGSLEQALAMQNLSDQRNAALLLISTLFL